MTSTLPSHVAETHTLRLAGDWQAQPVALDAEGLPALSGDWRAVPECAHLQPALYPDQPYWGEHIRAINQQAWVYRRVFTAPDVPFRRARLRFEGVDYFAEVWVNGRFAGRHEGHFAPFNLDVTRLLHPGAENTLLVRVSSPWDTPNPRGSYPIDHVIRGLVKGLYEHGEGVIPPDVNPLGIWRPVWLLLDNGLSIDHARIRTGMDGRIDLRLTVTNATPETREAVLRLDVQADNHDGPGVTASPPVKLAPGTQHIDYHLSVPEPRLWWPWDHGEANLYRLEASLLVDGQITGVYHDTFGLRTVRLERSPRRFTYTINERPVFVRGTSYMPGLYLSMCDREALARDVAFAREANLNLLRVHVHVAPPDLYDLCDRAGMLVWQDAELNWIHDDSPAFETRARALQREMIDLLGNHPSVITWACHNEPTMVYVRRHNLERRPDPALYADALEQDSTRPVFICSGQIDGDWWRSGDVHSYYGAIWTRRYTDMYRHHFKLNSEFGFEAPADAATLRIYPDVWERLQHLNGQIEALWRYQAALIQYQVEHLRRLRAAGCAGYVHFWLADLVPQVGCGVLDSERRPKGGYDALRRASPPLHVALEHDGRRPRALWVFNDTMQAYPGARLRWQARDEAGNMLAGDESPCSVAANTSQEVMRLAGAFDPRACRRLDLALHDGETLLAENHYQHPFQPLIRPRGYPWKFDPFLGTKVFDRPGAPSLADHNISPFLRLIPLWLREAATEWALRQRFPRWFVSAVARLGDMLMG